MTKIDLIVEIIEKLYFKSSKRYYYYLGISEESYLKIKNLITWLERQNLATLLKIKGRLNE